MSQSYRIVEPHPSLTTPVIPIGRGGSGNIARPKTYKSPITHGPTASGPASKVPLPSPPTNGRFMSGRGGAGNMIRERERAIFSFDEELAAQRRLMEGAAPVYHVGRGGFGNAVYDRMTRKTSWGAMSGGESSTSSGDSDITDDCVNEKKGKRSLEMAWSKVRETFSRQ